jgi:hypothetical protein
MNRSIVAGLVAIGLAASIAPGTSTTAAARNYCSRVCSGPGGPVRQPACPQDFRFTVYTDRYYPEELVRRIYDRLRLSPNARQIFESNPELRRHGRTASCVCARDEVCIRPPAVRIPETTTVPSPSNNRFCSSIEFGADRRRITEIWGHNDRNKRSGYYCNGGNEIWSNSSLQSPPAPRVPLSDQCTFRGTLFKHNEIQVVYYTNTRTRTRTRHDFFCDAITGGFAKDRLPAL